MDTDTEVTLKIDQDTQSLQVVEPEEHSEVDVKLEIEQVEDTKSNAETEEDDEWYDAQEEIVEK